MEVISLGGSLIWHNDAIRVSYIKEFQKIVVEKSREEKICVVVGGGEIARKYVKAGRDLLLNECFLDSLGILLTRANAMLLINSYSYPSIPSSVEECVNVLKNNNLVYMGGTEPGHTTDAVAALIAERLGCERIINLSNVDGIYDKDPRIHKDAKLLREISYEVALKLSLESFKGAATNFIIDPIAIKIAARSKIKIIIIDGNNLENFRRVLYGKSFHGSTIHEI